MGVMRELYKHAKASPPSSPHHTPRHTAHVYVHVYVHLRQASSEYFQRQHVPQAVSKLLPNVKLIASLRDPTDAFISKWLQTISSDSKRVEEFETKSGACEARK